MEPKKRFEQRYVEADFDTLLLQFTEVHPQLPSGLATAFRSG